MRCILDTNVLVSSLIFGESDAAKAVRLVLDYHQALVSDETLAELKYVLQKPKIHKYAAPEKLMEFYVSYKRITTSIPILTTIQACRDPKDDKFLELAVNGGAEYIITGDQDLLVLHPFRKTQILSAKDFIATILS